MWINDKCLQWNGLYFVRVRGTVYASLQPKLLSGQCVYVFDGSEREAKEYMDEIKNTRDPQYVYLSDFLKNLSETVVGGDTVSVTVANEYSKMNIRNKLSDFLSGIMKDDGENVHLIRLKDQTVSDESIFSNEKFVTILGETLSISFVVEELKHSYASTTGGVIQFTDLKALLIVDGKHYRRTFNFFNADATTIERDIHEWIVALVTTIRKLTDVVVA